MSRKHCVNCGEPEYNGACTNCHEAVYIADQYQELDMPLPKSFAEEVNEAERDVRHKKYIEATI